MTWIGQTFDDEVSYTSEVYVEDRFSEYVGPGLYTDNTLAFPKAIATTFDGIAIDKGTKVTIYSKKILKVRFFMKKLAQRLSIIPFGETMMSIESLLSVVGKSLYKQYIHNLLESGA